MHRPNAIDSIILGCYSEAEMLATQSGGTKLSIGRHQIGGEYLNYCVSISLKIIFKTAPQLI